MENRADPLADELRGGFDGFIAVLDEDGYFPGTWRLEDAGELGYGLLKNLRRTYVDFSDNYHDGHVERERDSKMLSEIVVQQLPTHNN